MALIRPRKLDFSIHAAQTTDDEDDNQLTISDIPPSPPL